LPLSRFNSSKVDWQVIPYSNKEVIRFTFNSSKVDWQEFLEIIVKKTKKTFNSSKVDWQAIQKRAVSTHLNKLSIPQR